MSLQTVIIAILIISSVVVTSSKKRETPGQCLEQGSDCRLLSNPCCQGSETRNGSSSVVKRHCDYLERRVCVPVDQIYRYQDVLLMNKLKDDDDFQSIYSKYVEYLAKIDERLVLKRFMDRMYESKPPARNYGYGKI